MDKSKWEYKKWADVLNIINGRDYKEVAAVDGAFPICGSGGEIGRASEYLCPENTVIIGRKGNINKPLFIEEKFWNIDTAFGLVAKSEYLIPKFLFYFCLHYDFERHNKAVTIPSLTKGDLLKINMLLPKVSDQQRIVAELDCLNEMIAVKQEQLKEFDKLAQSIFYDMFGDPANNDKGWTSTTLGEHFVFSQGLQVPTDLQYFEEGNNRKRFLRIIDFTQGNEPARYIEEDSEKYYLHSNEIALVRYGTPGFVCMGKEGVIANNLFKITSQYSDVNNWFLYFFLNSDAFQKPISANQYGATMKAISFGGIKKIPFILPPLELQQQFADKISAIEAQKELVKQSIAETQTLLDYTMDYYFN